MNPADPLHPNSSQSPNKLSPVVLAHLVITMFYVYHGKDPNVESEVSFKNDLLYWLARSVYQIDPPSPSYSHFKSSLEAALTSDPSTSRAVINQLLRLLDLYCKCTDSVENLESLFSDLKKMLSEPEGLFQNPAFQSLNRILDKRSFLGTQLRRHLLKYNSMDILEMNQLIKSCIKWWKKGLDGSKTKSGSTEDEEISVSRAELSRSDYPSLQNKKVQNSDQEEDDEEQEEEGEEEGAHQNPRLKAFDEYQSSLRRGDYSSSRRNLHSFFDYTPLGSERDLHQHFLLNLAYFHYEFGSLEASHDSLLEAITLSRRNNDFECLDLCDSLLKRLIREADRDLKSNPHKPSDGGDFSNFEPNLGEEEEEDSIETWRNIQRNRNRKLKTKAKMKEREKEKLDGNGHSLFEEVTQDQNDGIIGTEDEIWRAVMDLEAGKSIPSTLLSLLHTLDPAPLPPLEKVQLPDAPAFPQYVPKTTVSASFTHPSAVLARLWSNMGEREISLVQLEIARNGNVTGNEGRWEELIRIQAECMKAWDMAESGQYDLSLALLLSHSTISNLSFSCYKIWFSQVWRVLWLKSRRGGDVAACRWVKSKSPQVEREVDGAFDLEKYWKSFQLGNEHEGDTRLEQEKMNRKDQSEHEFGKRNWWSAEEKLKGMLFKAKKLKEAKQPSLSLSSILRCISLSSSQGFMTIHRQALIRLADVMLDLGMAEEARKLMEKEMEMLLEDHNLERRGEAQWVYAKSILASGRHSVEDLHHAIAWLKRSDQDFESTGSFPSRLPILYYLARLYHTLGDVSSRDSISEEHGRVDRIVRKSKADRIPQDWGGLQEIEELVELIGSRVGRGWQ